MNYYSLNNQSPIVDFKAATIKGQAPDKGLYFPEYIPKFPNGFVQKIEHLTKEEIAFTTIQPFIGNAIPTGVLEDIVAETVNFDFPLVGP